MNGEKRGPGRPRLPTPERRRNVLASKAKWRHENYEYYLNQKRELANRPEYLTRRRELRATKQTRIWVDVSDDCLTHTILDYATDESTLPVDSF